MIKVIEGLSDLLLFIMSGAIHFWAKVGEIMINLTNLSADTCGNVICLGFIITFFICYIPFSVIDFCLRAIVLIPSIIRRDENTLNKLEGITERLKTTIKNNMTEI